METQQTPATPMNLPKAVDDPEDSGSFIPLPWFLDTVSSLELCLRRKNVPLVCGPVGCGKTSAIDYVASRQGKQTFRMQISEQTDTKVFFNSINLI